MPKGARLWRLWRGPYRVDAQTKACQPCTPIPRTEFRATVRVDARGTHADASRRERLRRTRETAVRHGNGTSPHAREGRRGSTVGRTPGVPMLPSHALASFGGVLGSMSRWGELL